VDHHGKGFYMYERKWTLPEFKKITEEEQRLTKPQYDAWSCNYLYVVSAAAAAARLTRKGRG
jgi:hypothetical protein